MWFLIALLDPIFYGVANVLDNFLTNKSFRNPLVLAFYSSAFPIIFVPILFLFYPLSLPPVSTLPIFVLLGIINVTYLYPYYKGLQSDDTSTAVSFFGLSRIFVPLWAFLIIGERLSTQEYVGVFLVIIGSVFLSVKGSIREIKFSKALFYILLASFILSFEGVLLKYLFENGVSVGFGMAGEIIFSAIFALVFLLHRETRLDIANSFSIFKNKFGIFFAEEAATFLAFFCGSYALSVAPVGLVKGITALTPFFILAYAKILGKSLPDLFNEQKGFGVTAKKFFLFSITALGVFLIFNH